MRSVFFVPADDPRKIAKALRSGADAVVLDLEDSVAESRKTDARINLSINVTKASELTDPPALIVRINPLDSPHSEADVAAAVDAGAQTVMLPKCAGNDDIWLLSSRLAVAEAIHGRQDGEIGILPIATESPAAVFAAGNYQNGHGRLRALTWGAEDLAAEIGASESRNADGTWRSPFELARNLCLFGAHAAGVTALDTVFTDFHDLDGLKREAIAARMDGFSGKLAIHPAQIEIINAAFTPTAADITKAEKIVAAFADSNTTGVSSLAGKMIDQPHLKAARALLQRAAARADKSQN
jgi:citrate lyase subunit beta/citryl-CoA lyase